MTAEDEQIQSAAPGIDEPPPRQPPKWSQIEKHPKFKEITPEKRVQALQKWGMDVARFEQIQPETPEFEQLSAFIDEQFRKYQPGAGIGVARQVVSAPVKAFGSTVGQMATGVQRLAYMSTGGDDGSIHIKREREEQEQSGAVEQMRGDAYSRYLQAVRDAGFDPKDQTLASPRIFKDEQAAMDAGLQPGALVLISQPSGGGRKKRIGFDLETFRDPAEQERNNDLGRIAMPPTPVSEAASAIQRVGIAGGEAITSAAQSIPTNPNFDEQFWLGDVLGAAGSVPPYLVAGLFGGPLLVAAAGVSQQMENAYQTAVAEGKPELALEQMIYQSPIGVLQTVGVGGLPLRSILRDTPFGKQIQSGVWRYVFAGAREGIQESLLGGLPTDISEYYGGVRPDDSPWTADAWVRRMREAGAGFIAGAGVTAAQAKIEKAHAFKALQGLAVVDAMEQVVDGTAPQMQELKAVVEDKSAPAEARAEAEAKIEAATQQAQQYLDQAKEQLELGKQEVNNPTPAEPATPDQQQQASEQRIPEDQPPVVRETESLQEVTPDVEAETRQNQPLEGAIPAGEQRGAEGVDIESSEGAGAVAADAVSETQQLTPKEWAKTLPDAEAFEKGRMPNTVDAPYKGDFKEGQLHADHYGDDPYVYRAEFVDPSRLRENLKLEGMTYEAVANMPTTQKYIEWYKEGNMPPPITLVFNDPSQKLQSTNRRRVVAALEAGITEIPALVEIGRASEIQQRQAQPVQQTPAQEQALPQAEAAAQSTSQGVTPFTVMRTLDPASAKAELESIRAGDARSKNEGKPSVEPMPREEYVETFIPVNLIDIDRSTVDESRVSSYKDQAIDTPIHAVRHKRSGDKNRFFVMDGGHRLVSAIDSGATTIRALVPISSITPSPQSSEQSGLGAGAATVTEQSGQAKVAPAAEVAQPDVVFTREQIEVGKPMVSRRKSANGTNGESVTEIKAPGLITEPDNWYRLSDVDKINAHVESRINFETGKVPSKKDAVWTAFGGSRVSGKRTVIQRNLTYDRAIEAAKDYVQSANPIAQQVDESTPARVEGEYGTEPGRTGETRSETQTERGTSPLGGVDPDPTPIRTTETDRAGQWFESHYEKLRARAEQLGAPDPESAATDAVLKVAAKDVQGDPLPLLYANLKQQSTDQWRGVTKKVGVDPETGKDVRAPRLDTTSLDAPLSTEGDMTLADTQESGEATPAQAAEQSERATLVRQAVSKLPERQQVLVQRIFFEGKKPADVARELGLSKTTIGKDYQAASVALKDALISLSGDATPQSSDRRLGLVPDSFVQTQNFVRWLREWATTWKNVPRELVPALDRSQAAQRGYYERGRLIIRDLKTEARRAYGKDSAKGEAAIREALLNPAAMDALPDKVKAETMRLRNLMDELSIRAVNEVIVDPELALTIMDNTGSYMRRSYKVFSDPEWYRKVDPVTLRNGKTWIKNNWDKKRTLTDTEVDIVVAELLDADKAGGFILGGSKIGGKDVTSLTQRKTIAPEVRALMGEITNPYESAAETIRRQANMIEQHRAQQVMRRVGLATGIFSAQKTPTHFKPVAPAKNPGSHDVLAGLYTTPDVMDSLTEFYKSSGKPSFGNIFFDTLRSFAGAAKATKTVLAPVTWPVNYIGAVMTMTAQGNLNPAAYGRGVVHVLEQTGLLQRMSGNRPIFDRQKLQDRIALLTKHGLLNQQLTAGDMILSVERSLLGRIPGVKDLTKAAAGIFQAGDNIVKFASWEQEMKRYKQAYPTMPEAELETRVAEVVASTTQMYERTPVTLKEASIVLPFQSFINFQYDMMRVSVNTARLAKAEIEEGRKTGNQALVRTGQIRALAFTGTMLAASNMGVALLSRMYNEVDEEEEEAMRYFMPPWFQDSNIFWASGIEDGKATYANVGYLLPHANVIQAFESGWREGDGFTGVFNKTLEGFGAQYIQEPVHLNPLLDAIRNTNQRGREIVNREDPNKTLKLAGYVMEKTFKPGFVDQINRVAMAVNEETGPYGQEYSVKEEMMRMMAVRAQTVDVRKNLPFKVRELQDRWQNATNLYRLSKNRNLPQKEMDKRYADAEKARQDVFQEFVKMRELAGRLDIKGTEVDAIMRGTPGMARALVRDVALGEYRPLPVDH